MNNQQINEGWYTILTDYASVQLQGHSGLYSPIGERSRKALKCLWMKNQFGKIDLSKMIDEGQKIALFSDPHIGHTNIIKLCNRPFLTGEEMDKHLLGNIRGSFKQYDFVICLGDLSVKQSYIEHKHLKISFPNQYALLIGNHDVKSAKNEVWAASGALPSLAFSLSKLKLQSLYPNWNIVDWEKVPTEVKFGLSHWPVHNDHLPEGWINIHGHIHNRKEYARHINVSVEVTNYQPDNILNLIQEKHILSLYEKNNELENHYLDDY